MVLAEITMSEMRNTTRDGEETRAHAPELLPTTNWATRPTRTIYTSNVRSHLRSWQAIFNESSSRASRNHDGASGTTQRHLPGQKYPRKSSLEMLNANERRRPPSHPPRCRCGNLQPTPHVLDLVRGASSARGAAATRIPTFSTAQLHVAAR